MLVRSAVNKVDDSSPLLATIEDFRRGDPLKIGVSQRLVLHRDQSPRLTLSMIIQGCSCDCSVNNDQQDGEFPSHYRYLGL